MFKILQRPLLKYTKSVFQRSIAFRQGYYFSKIEGKRANETTAGSITIPATGKIGGSFKLNPSPIYCRNRARLFEEIYQRQKSQLDSREKREINITLPDGKVIQGKCWETTPLEIAKKISRKLGEAVVAAKIVYSKRDQSEFGGGTFLMKKKRIG